MAQLTIIGAGYVGLVTAGCFAQLGHNVIVHDIDQHRIANLQKGIVPIFEPGLEPIIAENLANKRLQFSTDLQNSVKRSQAIFICVGTPQSDDGTADMRHVDKVSHNIASLLDEYKLIINKSTVPMGTARALSARLQALNPQAKFDVISNPEFLREGEAINDFLKPDRIIIGVSNDRPRSLVKQIYAPLTSQGTPILWVEPDSAELIKYATNAFLAVKLSFINELSDLCEVSNAIISDVITGLGADQRIGRTFLNPGPGYGGSCFPKDTKAILRTAQSAGIDLSLIARADAANVARKANLIHKITRILGSVQDKQITILGLSFKANTDDIRESPAWDLVPALQQAGAKLVVTDPQAKWDDGKNIRFERDVFKALENSDCAVVLTEWNEYRQLPWGQIAPTMRSPRVIDFRNLYNRGIMAQIGVDYFPLGMKFSPAI